MTIGYAGAVLDQVIGKHTVIDHVNVAEMGVRKITIYFYTSEGRPRSTQLVMSRSPQIRVPVCCK
jgi:hypothetical protein